jgi:hypothetical protein
MNKIKRFYINKDIQFNGFYNLKLISSLYNVGSINKIIEDVWYDSDTKIGTKEIFFWAIACIETKIHV